MLMTNIGISELVQIIADISTTVMLFVSVIIFLYQKEREIRVASVDVGDEIQNIISRITYIDMVLKDSFAEEYRMLSRKNGLLMKHFDRLEIEHIYTSDEIDIIRNILITNQVNTENIGAVPLVFNIKKDSVKTANERASQFRDYFGKDDEDYVNDFNCFLVNTLNRLETLCSQVRLEIANDKIVYSLCGKTVCNFIKSIYPYIALVNFRTAKDNHQLSHVIYVYNKWKKRLYRNSKNISTLRYNILLHLSENRIGFDIEMNHYEIEEGRPVIFACNHSNCHDAPIILHTIGVPCHVLYGRQRLNLSDWLFFKMSNAIQVTRHISKQRNKSKECVKKYLLKGRNILWFPEATWNLTDNLPMLPMRWGIVEVAASTGAQVVPVIMEYDYRNKKCYVDFGETIIYDISVDKKKAIHNLRDYMSTMRWKLWENNGVTKRADVNIEEEHFLIKNNVLEYPLMDIEYEKSVIYNEND